MNAEFLKEAIDRLLKIVNEHLQKGLTKERAIELLTMEEKDRYLNVALVSGEPETFEWDFSWEFYNYVQGVNGLHNCGDETAPHIDNADELFNQACNEILERLS